MSWSFVHKSPMACCRVALVVFGPVVSVEEVGMGVPSGAGACRCDNTARIALTGDVGAMVASPREERPILVAV